MNSPNPAPRKITAAQASHQLLIVAKNGTVRAVGMAQPLEDLAMHLLTQDARMQQLTAEAATDRLAIQALQQRLERLERLAGF